MRTHRRLQLLLYGLAILKLIIPYFLQNSIYEPHRDEFLYLAEGHHLAWGFMEVPPVLSIFAWLTHLAGDGFFWIKFWPSVFGAATFIIAGRLLLSLGGRAFALLLLFLPFIFGAYLRIFFLFQPNAPEIFFWTLMGYGLVRKIQTGREIWVYVFWIATACGMLTKYSVSFFAVSLIVGLLATRHGKIIFSKHFLFASLIAFVIFLPNIIWQYNHHFPVIHHMKELRETQLQYVSPADFLINQLLMNLPAVFIWLSGLFYVAFSGAAKKFRFVSVAYLCLIVLLLIGHGKDYYSLGVYPVLFAFGAFRLEQVTIKTGFAWRYAFVIVPLTIGLLMIPIMLPIFTPSRLSDYYVKMNTAKTGALKWEDLQNHPLPQDFADMLGWEEMARKMGRAFETLDSNEQKHTILFCDNYGMAGAVSFYAKKYHLPQAYSDNASFLYWLPNQLKIDNLLLITGDKQEMQHEFIKNFISASVVDSIVTPMARERGDLIILLKGANDAFNRFFHEKIESDKAGFH